MRKRILAFGASSSRASINKQLATHVASRVPDAAVTVLDLNDFEMPLYSIDRQNEDGFPAEAQEFIRLIGDSDGLVISLAEHNSSYAAVFKNLMDWSSRIDRKLWGDKPMLLLSTSPGGRGGATVLAAALSAFPRAGANLVGSHALPNFHSNLVDDKITDLDHELAIQHLIELLVEKMS